MRPRVGARAWRSFDWRDRRVIRAQLAAGAAPRCPRCENLLEARPASRLRAVLPARVRACDLDCRVCRQFFPFIQPGRGSPRLDRLRRLADAVLHA